MESSSYRNRRDTDHIYDRLYNNHYSAAAISMVQPHSTDSYFPPHPTSISSDVVEITGAQGGVGFVAVGRLSKSSSHNPVSFDEIQYCNNDTPVSMSDRERRKLRSKSENRHKKQQDRVQSPVRNAHSASEMLNNQPIVPAESVLSHLISDDHNHASHSRHTSDPSIYSDKSDRGLVRYPNSIDLTMNADPVTNLSPSGDNPSETTAQKERASTKVRRPKKLDVESSQSNTGKTKDQTKHKSKRSRRIHTATHTPSTGETTQSHAEASTTPNIEERSKPKSDRNNTFVIASPLCKQCGQRHRLTENHEYDYIKEIDDDLQCDICLQPFVDPYDTKCGHTFCGICLKNYVLLKKMCPVDRKELTFSAGDCWQSSLVMRKLVNKLQIRCPHTDHCKLKLPRTDLEAHLKERCPGGILRCTKAMYGCSYRGPRVEQVEHVKVCKFQQYEGNPIDQIYPDCLKHTVELFRPEGVAELGLAVVGGNDTPLRNVIVQAVMPGSLVAEDGRILPGDIIIEVNGEDFHNVGHVEARAILSRSAHLMRFTLLREKLVTSDGSDPTSSGDTEAPEERISVSLLKPPSEQLGIKITTCEDERPGVYILELVEGRVAHANGKLKPGDRILEISQADLRNGTPESAARIIQSSGERVNIVVSRHSPRSSAHDTIVNPWATDKTLPRSLSSTQQQQQATPTSSQPRSPSPNFLPVPELQSLSATYKEKVISVTKAPQESLGIVVAGGTSGSRGDLPVFVQDVQPQGVLGRDRKLLRGDLLMQVNGIQLTGLSHTQAISVLKDAAQHCKEVELVAIELSYSGKEEDFALWEELSGVLHQQGRRGVNGVSCWASWTPSWRMWLAVPPQCRLVREVSLRRQQQGLGFSIVGGRVGPQAENASVFVKYVVPGGAAATQGNMKCGDEIVAINGREAAALTHSAVVQALKGTPGSITLTVMSWPGSLH